MGCFADERPAALTIRTGWMHLTLHDPIRQVNALPAIKNPSF
jgi:hypothetical protein